MRSMVCRYEHFLTDWYARQCGTLCVTPAITDEPLSYRKLWEWAAILQALTDEGMLCSGKTGIGFAVGREPLVSIFAGKGVSTLASDQADGGLWSDSAEHAESLDSLFLPEHVGREQFDRLTRFRAVDMNDISALPDESADFIWSSCAIEHVGTLDLAKAFVKNAMRLVRPGGLAVHTTEINCSSNDDTIEEGGNVLFRRRDIEALACSLRDIRCGMADPDFEMGVHRYDLDYDEPPYFTTGRKHIKLKIDGFVSTSFLMVIHKGG